MRHKKSQLDYFEERLSEARTNERGSMAIVVLGALIIGVCFILPEQASLHLNIAISSIGLILSLIGVLELSYHRKSRNEYQDLIEQLLDRCT